MNLNHMFNLPKRLIFIYGVMWLANFDKFDAQCDKPLSYGGLKFMQNIRSTAASDGRREGARGRSHTSTRAQIFLQAS